MAKLVVLDPSGLFRAALVSLLQRLGFDELVEAGDFDELDPGIASDAGTVVLINLSRGSDAIDQLVRKVRDRLPQAKIVFLSPELDLETLARCFAAGASGYLLENISSDALSKSLTLVSAGGKVFPPELAPLIPNLAAKPVEEAPPSSAIMLHNSRLSEREIEILRCLTRGQSNKAIAHTLEIAEATVKVHVKRILRKIAAANRTQAALWAASRGLGPIANGNHRAAPVELLPVGLTSGPRHVAMRQAVAIKTSGRSPIE